MDDRLLDNDMLRLTETQCEAGNDTSIVESAMQKKYTMYFNNSDNNSKVLLMVCQMEFLFLTFKNNILLIIPFQLH